MQKLLRPVEARLIAHAPQPHRLEIKLIGLRIGRRFVLLDAQLQLKILRDQPRDLLLDGEDILQVAVEIIRPHLEAVGRLDQLRGDAHLLTRPTDAAFDDIGHAQLPRDLRDGRVLAFEVEGRGARRHLQARHLAQHVQEFLAHAVGERLIALLLAEIGEGQHGDGFLIGDRRRGHISFAERWLPVEIPTERQHDEQRSRGKQTLAARGVGIELHALGCEIKHPGHHHRDWKTQQCDQDKNAQRPRRRIEGGKSDRGRLHHEPGRDQIGCADLKYFAAFQLGEEIMRIHLSC